MTDVLSKIPLVGWGPIITHRRYRRQLPHHRGPAVAQPQGLALAVRRAVPGVRRRHRRGLASTRGSPTTTTWPTSLGIPTYPTVDGNVTRPRVKPQPNGAVTKINVPDTASQFGSFEANVWLPPQYFTDPRAHFPVVYLLHGNPGADHRLADSAAAAADRPGRGARPASRSSSSCPTVLQNGVTGDSLCVDTESQGNAETYLTKDVIAAIDNNSAPAPTPSTGPSAACRWAATAPSTSASSTPTCSRWSSTSPGRRTRSRTPCPVAIQALLRRPTGSRRPTRTTRASTGRTLDGSKGPAIWMDVGTRTRPSSPR